VAFGEWQLFDIIHCFSWGKGLAWCERAPPSDVILYDHCAGFPGANASLGANDFRKILGIEEGNDWKKLTWH